MMRMKERRREYAEIQLAFSKVSLINEVKQGKYNVHIGNHQQVSFLFCPEKVTDLLEKNKYWAEQVESLGGNIKGELMISLKEKISMRQYPSDHCMVNTASIIGHSPGNMKMEDS